MKQVNISVIGAGGTFTAALIYDLCLTPNLHGSNLCLMDTNADRLADSMAICKRIVKDLGGSFTFRATTDRRECLKGADFVITTALIDGHRRLSDGWRIAESYGIKWGGSYHILYDEPFWLNFYQLKLFESITEDILEICPNAWHLLVSNPVITAITHLYRKYKSIKLLGLCHGFAGVYEICDVLGLDRESFTFTMSGVNHFVWLTSAHHKGRNVFEMIDAWLSEGATERWANHPEGTMGRKKMDMYRKYGAIPIGDTASITGASWPWLYHATDATEERWGVDSRTWWWEYVNGLGRNAKALKMLGENCDTPAYKFLGLNGVTSTGEPMIPIIEAMTLGIERVVIANVLNDKGYVPGLPTNFEVEIPTLVSADGVKGIHMEPLPQPILAHIMRDRIAPVELEIEAYRTGSREILLDLIMTDKWIRGRDHAESFLTEIINLPYHTELKGHYR